MRIENGVSSSQRVDIEARPQNDNVKTKDIKTAESYQSLAHKSELQLSMDEKQWINLIERTNKALTGGNRNFEFSIHEATKEIVVKVIDTDTNEVIREIPNQKILDMVAKMWELAGIFVDERR